MSALKRLKTLIVIFRIDDIEDKWVTFCTSVKEALTRFWALYPKAHIVGVEYG